MSKFTEAEIAFILTQRLGRLATVTPEGKPQNAPVTFHYNAEFDAIDIGGLKMSTSKKFRNILQNPNVAFVIDDVQPPWTPRGVEIRGLAQGLIDGGKAVFGKDYSGDEAIIRITAEQIIGWGLDDPNPYKSNNRKVK